MLGLGLSVTQLAVRGLRLTDLAAAIRALFAAGEQGVWYDPSDLTTLFQDAAGATPVTAVEQPVGLMLDKSRGLTLGPELVTNGDFSNGTTGWTVGAGWTISGGQASVVGTTALTQPIAGAPKWIRVQFDIVAISGSIAVNYNQTNGLYNAQSPIYTTTGTKTAFIVINPSATSGLMQIFFQTFSAGQTATVDNISVRELPGNHATQTTSTSRPVLSARYNLLTKTEQFDAGWGKIAFNSFGSGSVANTTAITDPSGGNTADFLQENSANTFHYITQNIFGLSANTSYTLIFYVQPNGRNFVYLDYDATGASCYFNLTDAGSVGTANKGGAGAITKIGNWFICSLTFTTPANPGSSNIRLFTSPNGTSVSYQGDGTSGIYIWGASLVPTNQAHLPYQRVNTATDYDTVGFPHYLRFDGVDDSLVTNSIDFTGTDKMSVFAGVRQLSTATTAGQIIELSVDVGNNNGAFGMAWPAANSSNILRLQVRGTVFSGANDTAATSPQNAVVSMSSDIAGDLLNGRRNGIQTASSTTDQGTGNYGNYPLYIGARAGTSLPFNGHLYSLIVRGAQSTEQQIIDAERYVNDKTRAYA